MFGLLSIRCGCVNAQHHTVCRVLKKTRLASPKIDWSPYSQQGLSMKVLDSKDGKGSHIPIQPCL